MQVIQKVRNFIAENTYGDMNEIHNDALIFKEGILDSMGFLKLITFIENEFNVQLLDEDIVEENFESVNAISRYITKEISKEG